MDASKNAIETTNMTLVEIKPSTVIASITLLRRFYLERNRLSLDFCLEADMTADIITRLLSDVLFKVFTMQMRLKYFLQTVKRAGVLGLKILETSQQTTEKKFCS